MRSQSFGEKFVTACLIVCLFPVVASAEPEFSSLLKKAEALKAEGKFAQALDELSWANEILRKLHLEKLQSFFPENVSGLAAGKFKSNNVLGLMSVERIYSGDSGAKMKVSLSGGATNHGATSRGVGALASLAQMAAVMDASGDSEVLRIQGRRATLSNQRGRLKLVLTIDSGMSFTIEQSHGTATKEQMVSIADAMNYEQLSTYLSDKDVSNQ